MILGKIIRKRRKELNLTLEDVSERIGYSRPYISTVETSKVRTPPREDFLVKVEDVLGFQRGELLYLAEMKKMPEQLRGQIEHSLIENARLRNMINQLMREDKTGQIRDCIKECGFELDPKERDSLSGIIPIVNKVSAGYPTDFDDMSYPVGVADDYINCPGLNDPHAFAVRVVGNSMSPEYMEGDIVVFSPAKTVNTGDDCFVRFKDPFEATFKRVYFERDKVRLQPRNTEYSPMIFDNERIDGIYKAVLKYQYI